MIMECFSVHDHINRDEGIGKPPNMWKNGRVAQKLVLKQIFSPVWIGIPFGLES